MTHTLGLVRSTHVTHYYTTSHSHGPISGTAIVIGILLLIVISAISYVARSRSSQR